MLVYEGPAEGLLEKVAELGGKRVRLEVVEEPAKKLLSQAERDENRRRLDKLMKGASVYPGRILTAEDFYDSES